MGTRLGFCLLLFASSISAASAVIHFEQWFGQFRPLFDKIMKEDCTEEFQFFRTHPPPPHDLTASIDPVTNCILGHLKEADKANMAAAAVVLGLLPTTLGLAGSNTTEVGLLALRRPLLAFLLAAGSPAVSPIRSFDYVDPQELLKKTPEPIKDLPRGSKWRHIIAPLEYVLACLALANLVFVSYEVCIRTTCSFAPQTYYQPALWAFLTVPIHVFGTLSVYLRVTFHPGPSHQKLSYCQRIRQKFAWQKIHQKFTWQSIRKEFIPSLDREDGELKIKDEEYLYIFLAWLVSMGTILHIIFGTLVFSSISFISTSDAIIVVVRYLSSTLLCRAVAMYELSGLRQALDRKKGGIQSDSEFTHMGSDGPEFTQGDWMGETHRNLPQSYSQSPPRKPIASTDGEDWSSLLRVDSGRML